MKSTPTRGVKQYLKPNAYNQSELDWTLMTICVTSSSLYLGDKMADGTFAVLMLIAGLTDMGFNHCGTDTGCLGRSEAQPRLSFSAGQVVERRAEEQTEVYLRYDLGHKNGPFGHAIGISTLEDGEAWIGFGQTYTFDIGNVYAELHAMPGLTVDNGGFDLGGPIAFRSGIELGWQNKRGWRVGLSFDHRSNAGIYDENPGIETVAFRVAIPTR